MALANGGITAKLSSESLVNPFNILMPQKRKELLSYQNYDYFFTDYLEELQLEEQVAGPQWDTFVEPKKVLPLVVNTAFNAGSTDASVDIIINSTDISSSTFARKGYVLRRANGDQLYITNVVVSTTTTITVLPLSGTNVKAGAVGEKLVVIGSASPEGSGSVTPYTGKPIQFTNYLQIQRGTAQGTGSLAKDMLWFDVPEALGLPENMGWIDYSVIAEYMRQSYLMNNTLLTGTYNQYTISAGTQGTYGGTTVQTTNGVIPQILNNGGNETVYTAQEPSLVWFNKVMNIIRDSYGDKENLMFEGQEFTQAQTGWMLDQFKNGGILYNAFGGKKEVAVNIGFDSIYINGYTFHRKNLATFDMPDGLGALGYSKNALIIPTSPVEVVSNREGTGKTMAKPIRLRYKSTNQGKSKVWLTDGARFLNQPTSGDDIITYNVLSEWGCELLAPWKAQFIRFSNQ